MSDANNTNQTEKLNIRCDEELLNELTEMKKLSGEPVAEIIRRAIKRYITAEKPKLLARLRAKLLSPAHRN